MVLHDVPFEPADFDSNVLRRAEALEHVYEFWNADEIDDINEGKNYTRSEHIFDFMTKGGAAARMVLHRERREQLSNPLVRCFIQLRFPCRRARSDHYEMAMIVGAGLLAAFLDTKAQPLEVRDLGDAEDPAFLFTLANDAVKHLVEG